MNKSIKINALFNATRQIVSYSYAIVLIVYISRVLGSDDYGRYNFCSSIISYFTMFATFGINTYAIREGAHLRNDKNKLARFCNELYSFSFITTLIAYAGLFVLIQFNYFFEYKNVLLLLSTPFIFMCIGTDWMSEMYEDYFYLTIRYIIVHLISLIFIILFVKRKEDLLVFVFLSVLPNILGNIVNILYLRKKYINPVLCIFSLKKHFIPLLVLFCNALAISIYIESDKTLLTIMQNNTVTGIYSIAVSIYTIIKTSINSLMCVSLPRISAMQGEGDEVGCRILQSKIAHSLLSILLPCVVGIQFMAEPIIQIAGGAEYIGGALSLRILSIALFFGCLAFFYVYAILLPRKLEKKVLIATIVGATLNILLNFLFIPLMSLNGAAFTTLLSEFVVVLLCIIFSRKYHPVRLSFREVFPTILGTIIISMICFVALHIFESTIKGLVVGVILSIFSYFATLLLMKDLVLSSLYKQIIKRERIKK